MKFSELNKEQKQLVVLAVGGVFTVFMILNNLVLGPMRASAAAAQNQTADLERKVNRGEAILRRERINQVSIQSVAAEIGAIREAYLPPEISRYTWALSQISGVGHLLGIQAQVREHDLPRYVPHTAPYRQIKLDTPMWVPYAVQVNFTAGYDKIIQFIDQLYKANPYISIGMLTIQRNPNQPENHLVQMVVEWPVLRFNEDINQLQALAEGSTEGVN
ncbi:MAG: hypothetical protein JJU29_21875 [Verrucomicrobia bacterium]|nr:hypothetical protein [Verrucomicrobiota bacterium]MCH8513717.1 hypothetical protein [Kiritimatiellia bacterium]